MNHLRTQWRRVAQRRVAASPDEFPAFAPTPQALSNEQAWHSSAERRGYPGRWSFRYFLVPSERVEEVLAPSSDEYPAGWSDLDHYFDDGAGASRVLYLVEQVERDGGIREPVEVGTEWELFDGHARSYIARHFGYDLPVQLLVDSHTGVTASDKVWVDCPRCGGTGRYSGGVCFRCEGAKGEWVSTESIERAKERAEEQRRENEEREQRLRTHLDQAQAEFAEQYPDHWAWVEQEQTERATGALGFIQMGDYEQAARLIEQVSGWSFGAKTAMPQSWRPVTERWWPHGHDVVVMTDVRRRRRHYEVYVLGQYIGGRERLDDAKALAEGYAGFSLDWVQEAAPPQEVVHYFWGPSTEWTEPVTYYRAALPQFIVSSLSGSG